MTASRTPNRLIEETSPYLFQHAFNPVAWYPWGEEAFARAREGDKPVFLSIGYSACHWCHVMEKESFENETTAAILNREFISIKVDREERPDIDSIYMAAVQMMTGHGGWPMSMFLTPAGTPFFGGTYFPPEDRYGVPGFPRVLEQIAEAWRNHRADIEQSAGEVRQAIARGITVPRAAGELSREALEAIARTITGSFDPVHGGFGGAPKFPPSMTLEFLLQLAHGTGDPRLADVVTTTLTRMARGGIYDQIGGGFHRYSVDARWLVPHFEKMLYDNALLARIYIHAWQWSRDPLFARIARETLDFVARELMAPEGGFYSTFDADSEGEEGKFYVWTRSEVMEALGDEEGQVFCALFDVTDGGNWEGMNILNVPRSPDDVARDLGFSSVRLGEIAARGKCHLYGIRSKRVSPARDEKVLAGWNGWMLAAFAEGAMAFDSEPYRDLARQNADFLIDAHFRDGALLRSWKDGRARIPALLEDYAGLAWGLVSAFEATQVSRYVDTARALMDSVLARFEDPADGSFFDTPSNHEELIARPKDLFDNATPGGNSVAIDVLEKLARYFDEPRYHEAAGRAFRATWPLAKQYPSGFGFFLANAGWLLGEGREIVITGKGAVRDALRRVAGENYIPHRVVVASPSELPLLAGRDPSREVAYVCRGSVCDEPTSDPVRFRELLLAARND
ncbi:MAG: thioredoxin domain-containing protein [Thermoanaerobaculia bacterium]